MYGTAEERRSQNHSIIIIARKSRERTSSEEICLDTVDLVADKTLNVQ
jgi:hypothetical protein